MSIRNTRRYITEAVSSGSGNFSLLVFLTIVSIASITIFRCIVLSSNSNQQIVCIITSNYTMHLTIFQITSSSALSQRSIYNFTISIGCQSMFSKRTRITSKEARIFIIQTSIVCITMHTIMLIFIARICIITRLILHACAETSKYRRVIAYRYFTRIYTF